MAVHHPTSGDSRKKYLRKYCVYILSVYFIIRLKRKLSKGFKKKALLSQSELKAQKDYLFLLRNVDPF